MVMDNVRLSSNIFLLSLLQYCKYAMIDRKTAILFLSSECNCHFLSILMNEQHQPFSSDFLDVDLSKI